MVGTDVCVGDKGRWYGDLALYFAECATGFTTCYGDIDDDFSGFGWGLDDFIAGEFYSIPWIKEK